MSKKEPDDKRQLREVIRDRVREVFPVGVVVVVDTFPKGFVDEIGIAQDLCKEHGPCRKQISKAIGSMVWNRRELCVRVEHVSGEGGYRERRFKVSRVSRNNPS